MVDWFDASQKRNFGTNGRRNVGHTLSKCNGVGCLDY